MITVYLNAEPQTISEMCCLADALKIWGYDNDYVAIAINKNFAAKSHYQTIFLNEGDSVDIVAPMQGG